MSIVFAAFSVTLRISSGATVTANPETFTINFSTANNTVTTGTVTPILYPSTETTNASKTITGSNITVDGSTNLTGLSATFVSPGDYITYKVYAVNSGEYTAYLNNINFLGSKTCEAVEGATDSLVQAACNGINVSVSVAGTSYSTTTPITGHSLAKGTGEEILVTLKYDSNATRADGPFTVSFGNVSLVYSTIDDSTFKPKACTLTDNDSSGDASLSDEVTCGTESFYVIDNVSGNVNMLSKYNITLSETTPKQDLTDTSTPSINKVDFASTAYWSSGGYSPAGDSNYNYVYDSKSLVYPYVEAYRDVLEGIGVNIIDAKLLSYEQVMDLKNNKGNPVWLNSCSYWTGSSADTLRVYAMMTTTGYVQNIYMSSTGVGIRPVITISASDLG